VIDGATPAGKVGLCQLFFYFFLGPGCGHRAPECPPGAAAAPNRNVPPRRPRDEVSCAAPADFGTAAGVANRESGGELFEANPIMGLREEDVRIQRQFSAQSLKTDKFGAYHLTPSR
jgi:hypothetical protein